MNYCSSNLCMLCYLLLIQIPYYNCSCTIPQCWYRSDDNHCIPHTHRYLQWYMQALSTHVAICIRKAKEQNFDNSCLYMVHICSMKRILMAALHVFITWWLICWKCYKIYGWISNNSNKLYLQNLHWRWFYYCFHWKWTDFQLMWCFKQSN